ncbi:hypothetical protein ACPCSE_30040 [Streptomyces cellulosae]
MTAISEAPVGQQLKPSALDHLTDDDARRIAALVVRDNEGVTTIELGMRIVDEALKFLVAAANNTKNRQLRPSKTVDMGWHALILHTEIYRDVCGNLGQFIHHRPEGPETLRRVATTLDTTQDAIREAGYQPDPYLWGSRADTEIKGGDCMHSECTQDGACAAPQTYPSPN